MAKEFAISYGLEAIDQVSAPLMKINAKIKDVSKSMNKFRSVGILPKTQEAMSTIRKSMYGLGKSTGIPILIDRMKGVGVAATNAGKAIKTMALGLSGSGLVLGGMGFGAVSIIKGMTEEGRELQESSQRIGLSTRELQKYQFAASSAGVSNEQLESAFTALGNSAIQASVGGGEASQVFEALGVKVQDAAGKIKKIDQLFLETSDAMNSKIHNKALKREMLSKVMGGSLALPMVNHGSKGIKENLKTAEKMNFFIDDKQIKNSESWTKSLATLSFTLRGIRNIIGAELLPVVTETFGKFSQYLIDNQGEIRSFFQDLAGSLPSALQSLKGALESLSIAFYPLMSVLHFVHDHVALTKAAMVLAALKIGAIVIPAVFALVGAFASLTQTLLANPIFLILAGFYRLVKVGQFIYEKFDKLKELFSDLFTAPLANLFKILKLTGVISKSFVSTDWAEKGLDAFSPGKAAAIPLTREAMPVQTNKPNISGKKEDTETTKFSFRFENAPPGLRMTSQNKSADVDIYRGFMMAGAQ